MLLKLSRDAASVGEPVRKKRRKENQYWENYSFVVFSGLYIYNQSIKGSMKVNIQIQEKENPINSKWASLRSSFFIILNGELLACYYIQNVLVSARKGYYRWKNPSMLKYPNSWTWLGALKHDRYGFGKKIICIFCS